MYQYISMLLRVILTIQIFFELPLHEQGQEDILLRISNKLRMEQIMLQPTWDINLDICFTNNVNHIHYITVITSVAIIELTTYDPLRIVGIYSVRKTQTSFCVNFI